MKTSDKNRDFMFYSPMKSKAKDNLKYNRQ